MTPAIDVTDSANTIAAGRFDNGALVHVRDYAPPSKGIADLLIVSLAANLSIRVVERDPWSRCSRSNGSRAPAPVDLELLLAPEP